MIVYYVNGDTADATQNFLSSFSPFGGGVGGGAAKKWQGNFGVACAEWNGARPRRNQTPMRTRKYRITTRSARHDHCPFSKWVRAKVSISAQNDTSRAESAEEPRAAGAREGRKPRRVATKRLGDGTEKWAVLSLVSYPKIIFSKL